MTIALIICIIGGLVYVAVNGSETFNRVAELGKWAFIVALAAWFLGK